MTALHFRHAPFDQEFISRPARVTKTRAGTSSWSGPLARWISALGAAFGEHFRRHRVMSELSRLTDRELADIGLSRSDIGQIYSEEFAARRDATPSG
ncbi:MAG: DUF1127 domain-containing protein [Acetobacteraceae bacterium]